MLKQDIQSFNERHRVREMPKVARRGSELGARGFGSERLQSTSHGVSFLGDAKNDQPQFAPAPKGSLSNAPDSGSGKLAAREFACGRG